MLLAICLFLPSYLCELPCSIKPAEHTHKYDLPPWRGAYGQLFYLIILWMKCAWLWQLAPRWARSGAQLFCNDHRSSHVIRDYSEIIAGTWGEGGGASGIVWEADKIPGDINNPARYGFCKICYSYIASTQERYINLNPGPIVKQTRFCIIKCMIV